MIYILIVLWGGASTSYTGKAALAVEFNDLPSCRAAVAEITRQSRLGGNVYTTLCAQKGLAK